MPADRLDPAQLHPDDAAAFDVLFDQLADIGQALQVAGLATAGLAAQLDKHHDLERYAPVQRVADRLTTAATLLSAGAQLLDLAQHLQQPVPLPEPEQPPLDLEPAPDHVHPLEVKPGPVRDRREPPAERPALPTEQERRGGPFVGRTAPTERFPDHAASLPADTGSDVRAATATAMRTSWSELSDQTVELPRVIEHKC